MRWSSARDGASNFAAITAVIILLAVGGAVRADAPATQPTTMPVQQTLIARGGNQPSFESIELGKKNSQTRTSSVSVVSGDSGMMRVVGALAVVLGSIFVFRWIGRKFFGLQAGGLSGGPVQVLARIPIGPRQQLMLIQVGRRIVLVGNCGTSMNPLCEISDADEVASLVGELQQRRKTSTTSAFLSIFGKAGAKFEEQQESVSPSSEIERDEIPARDPLVPELATTRQEMRGLLDRVHKLSKHYRRS